MDRCLLKRICMSLDLMIGIMAEMEMGVVLVAEGMTGPVVLTLVEVAAVAGLEIVKGVGVLGEVVAVEGIKPFCTEI